MKAMIIFVLLTAIILGTFGGTLYLEKEFNINDKFTSDQTTDEVEEEIEIDEEEKKLVEIEDYKIYYQKNSFINYSESKITFSQNLGCLDSIQLTKLESSEGEIDENIENYLGVNSITNLKSTRDFVINNNSDVTVLGSENSEELFKAYFEHETGLFEAKALEDQDAICNNNEEVYFQYILDKLIFQNN